MYSVTIQEFQSIEKASFTINGFTALVGRSNIGKSAIVRAIQAALTNALGTDFVRHGSHCSRRVRGTKRCKCKCSVHIQSEGMDLLWEKGDDVNQYTYNGEVYSRVDRGMPDFLLRDFNLVKVGDRKMLIQVADQADPILLLNQTGTVVADVLSDVAKLDDINSAMSDAEKDRKEAVSELRVRENDILKVETDLIRFDGLDGVTKQSREVSEKMGQVQGLQDEVKNLTEFFESLQELVLAIRLLRQVDEVEPPDTTPVETLGKTFEDVSWYDDEFAEKMSMVNLLSPVEDIEIPIDEILIESGRHLILLDALTIKTEVVDSLAPVADLSVPDVALIDVSELGQMVGWVEQIEYFKTLGQRWKGINSIADLEDPSSQDVIRLLDLVAFDSELNTLMAGMESMELALVDVDAAEAEIQSEWDALGVCPTCSQPVSREHTHHA